MMLCDSADAVSAEGAPARGVRMAIPVPPAIDMAARDDLKAYLRIAGDAEDDLIDRLVATATGHGEAVTGRLFVARQVIETLAPMADWRRLAWGPVRSILPPETLAIDGSAAPLPSGAYALDIDAAGDGRVRSNGGPGGGRWRIAYTAGLAEEWADLPDPLRQGAIRLAAHLYTHRDAADEGTPPAVVVALWRPWRRMRLA